ncbi:DUF887-domain-containing protein [Daldinia loculata]|uniref:DUF887-domain-containing protein n=1 Tax=Daldinia loculata TaxID=103429 RepID=UPI0020C35F32|nr:DUF887-domain-containing protein [Daldinia loculata]KAI1650560.1 DUF887-domain-containing protein [Daldinia loculata]
MRDPFPIPPIPALSKAVQPWADYLGLPTLPLHIHEVLLMAALYFFIGTVVSPFLSSRIFPTKYTALPRSKRLSWDVHVVSFVQSTTINILALWVMFVDEERKNMDLQERVWGYTGGAAMIQALAAGYFLYDLIITVAHLEIFGLGMLAHAISALAVYSFGFRPFLNYYSSNFILWELSSPFLNIHWFFDKLGMTGTKAQLYNGLILIATFFSCRLVWGTYQSVLVARDLWTGVNSTPTVLTALTSDELLKASFPSQYTNTMRFVSQPDSIPLWLAAVYTASNITLNSLNFYWFFKMIDAVRKRFDPKGKEVKVEEEPTEGKAVTTGAQPGSDELKNRPRRRTLLDGEEADEPPPI